MNSAAPSHSPADSISAESQPHGHVCERFAHKYPPFSPSSPPTHPSHHPKGASLMVMAKGCRCLVIECCWSWPWAHPRALSPSGRPTAERRPGGTRLKASSHTAAGCASPSVILTRHLAEAASEAINTAGWVFLRPIIDACLHILV